MALCCDIGIVSKKLISPGAKIITEYLHIPGGISTTFSLMFIVIGAAFCDFFGCATLMCLVQSIIAIIMGTVGHMGMLVIVSYLVPGLIIDVWFYVFRHLPLKNRSIEIILCNALAGVGAALCSNFLTFKISGIILWIYLGVAFASGILFGFLALLLVNRLKKIFK